MKTFLSIILSFGVLTGTSANAQKATPDAKELQADFALFRQALEESHPGVYRYRTKAEMDRLFNEAGKNVSQSSDVLILYKNISSVISKLGCGHTAAQLPDRWHTDHPVRKLSLPFDFRFVNKRAFITKNYSIKTDFSPQTEITSIDGKPMKDIVSLLFQYIRTDGFIETSKYKSLERNFSVYLQVFYKESPSYKIGLKLPSGKIVESDVKLESRLPIESPDLPTYEFKINESKVGVITIRSFGGGGKDSKGRGYHEFLKSSFEELNSNRIQSLIIDLRGNGGGNDDYGSLLYSYLTDKPFQYYSYLEMNKPTLSFIQYTDKQEGYRTSIENILTKDAEGRYIRVASSHPCLPLQQPQKSPFNGRLFVLIDGNSFSATSEFAAIVKDKKRGIFIGEETGGAYEGNTSGGSLVLTLPATQIKVYIPQIKYVSAVHIDAQQKGRGILPDIEITPSLLGIISNTDEVLSTALKTATK